MGFGRAEVVRWAAQCERIGDESRQGAGMMQRRRFRGASRAGGPHPGRAAGTTSRIGVEALSGSLTTLAVNDLEVATLNRNHERRCFNRVSDDVVASFLA